MTNLKKRFTDAVKRPKDSIKHHAESMSHSLKEGAEDLSQKIQEGSDAINKNFKKPMPYNCLIFIVPIILILLNFITMAPWIVQITRIVIFLCIGYVLFFDYRAHKKHDAVFFIATVLVVLFNPIMPFYIPGVLINVLTIVAIGYLYNLTQMDRTTNSASHSKNSKTSSVNKTHKHN